MIHPALAHRSLTASIANPALTRVTPLPGNVEEWGETYEILAPSAIWLMQAASAPVPDRVGTRDLESVIGTPDFAQAGEPGRRAVLCNGTEALRVLDTSFLNSDASTSISLWLRLFIPATLATTRGLATKRDSAGAQPGWASYVSSTNGRILTQIDDSTISPFAEIVADHRNAWHNVIVVVNRDLDELRIRSDLAAASVVDISTLGDASTAAESFGLGAGYVYDAESQLYTYAAAWEGYALTPAEAATLAAVTP